MNEKEKQSQAELPSRDLIDQALANVYPSFALLAGMQLDVFAALANGPMTAQELAPRINASEDKLSLLLYALVAAGFLDVSRGHFQNNKMAATYLVPGSPNFIGVLHELLAEVWTGAINTAKSVRTGIPVARHDFATMSESEKERFFLGLDAEARTTGEDLSRRFSFEDRRALVDVGGGSGGLAVAMVARWPGLRATIMELPNIAPITKRFVRSSDVSDRIEVVAQDATSEHLDEWFHGAYDVAILRALIQVLGPEDGRRALIQVGKMLKPGGKIYVVGKGIIDDTRTAPKEAVFYNLVFLNLYDAGQAYSESEYRRWLQEAGFIDINRIVRPDGGGIISARKG